MAKKTSGSASPLDESILEAILESIRDLYGKHANEIKRVREESETNEVTVNYAVMIDCAQPEATIKVRQRFTQTVTDVRDMRLDDPAQGTFVEITGKPKGETEDLPPTGEGEEEADDTVTKKVGGKKGKGGKRSGKSRDPINDTENPVPA